MDLPPIPPWEGAHPIVVHFPLALLLVAPVLVVLSLLVPKLRRGIALSALAVMALGGAGASLAVASGEATEHAVERTPEGRAAEDLIEEHSEARFSHALCQECMRKHYPEVSEDLDRRR